ncbi:MAG: hypothetical protein F4069_11420 [Rhodothermaceae bacterium]|nr:hypothetical protein [Rhodothermaceae bacterium]MXZ17482.1 hypothetical protein [Rhodothermaceae bacterium]MYC03240.1 hypothetical protein [Rhodothermaceae bacterium]MYG69808.1 hypothetical protein [Rhodothermaceae bacterium]MYI16145.1 hypothetical protein [Rhodothermaceae bacterium]
MRNSTPTPPLVYLVVFLLAGCRSQESAVHTARSPTVPFDELFVLEDTVRLDSAILIGQIAFIDVNPSGEILVTDHQADITYLFSSSGDHLRSYSAFACLSDDVFFYPWSTRFLGNEHVVAMQFAGPAVVFKMDGSCYANTKMLMPYAKAICIQEDSIFAQQVWIEEQAKANVYSPMLEKIEEILIEPPRLISLNMNYAGQRGRTIDCFDDGPYYVYAESMDAIPVRSSSSGIQYRPDFFQWRPEDLPDAPPHDINMRRQQKEYPSTIAVFALDGSTRMVSYSDLESQWHSGDINADRQLGLSISSNSGQFPARSTISPVYPQGAGNGYFYAVGENELLPDGSYGNPLILRYKFIVPDKE